MTAKKPVYFNHDGGVDDLVSLFLLLQMESVDLIGVSVIDADCYVEPAVSASRKIIDRYGAPELKGLEVSRSNSRPKNPFPKEWRMHAFYVDALPLLNERAEVVTKEADKLAHLDLIEKVHASKEPVTLLFTGPLTDLARALDEDATIESNIEKLYWMGGTFLPDGNVHEPEHDGTAEWNSYWDPEAAKRVWDSGIAIDKDLAEADRPARRPEGQKARRPEGQKARRPEGQKARRPEGQKARRPEGQKARRGTMKTKISIMLSVILTVSLAASCSSVQKKEHGSDGPK